MVKPVAHNSSQEGRNNAPVVNMSVVELTAPTQLTDLTGEALLALHNASSTY